jgi:hypothetical protein
LTSDTARETALVTATGRLLTWETTYVRMLGISVGILVTPGMSGTILTRVLACEDEDGWIEADATAELCMID